MPDALSLALFLITVFIVCFVVHIMCQNHKLNKEKVLSSEKISRMFDHMVVRPARQAKTSKEWIEQYRHNCMALGACLTFQRIYEGVNPPLSEIIGQEPDKVIDSLLKFEDELRSHMFSDEVIEAEDDDDAEDVI